MLTNFNEHNPFSFLFVRFFPNNYTIILISADLSGSPFGLLRFFWDGPNSNYKVQTEDYLGGPAQDVFTLTGTQVKTIHFFVKKIILDSYNK